LLRIRWGIPPERLLKIYAPGTRIDRYEVAGRPLMGGMGIVYLCHDLQEDRPVALKTFKPEFLPDRAARDRFLREGTAWVDLGRHPHVVRCYRVFQPENAIEVYLALELVAKEPGRDDASLRAWLTPGQPLPLEQALLFALQVARGMGHAVATLPGFVHRDLKPENVLVGADKASGMNRLRVTDFGLAALLQGMAPQTSEVLETSEVSDALSRTQLTHGIVGTPLYMAPEQWCGERVSVATDVYALGCILYEVLAGQPAVTGRSLKALKRAHCEGEVQALPGSVPGAVVEVVKCCLAVAPEARYGDWGQVEAALARAYQGLTGREVPTPEPVAEANRTERVAVGWSYSALGVSYLDLGKAEVALGYFRRAVEVGKNERERRLEATGLNHLGLAYSSLGQVEGDKDHPGAIDYYEGALVISREIGDRRGEGNHLGNLGSAYHSLGQVGRAIDCYEGALAISREIGDRRGESNRLGNLGNVYADLGQVEGDKDHPGAIDYYEGALVISREIGDRRGEGTHLGSLGAAYYFLGQVERAIAYYEDALVISREIGDRRGEGTHLGNLGNVYADLGQAEGDKDHPSAIAYYEGALVISREIGDQRGEGSSLGNLGNAYYSLGQVKQSIAYYEQALVISREIGDRRGEGAHLGNLGLACADLGQVEGDKDHPGAIAYYEGALAISREIGDRRNEGSQLGNLGLAYADLGQAERARNYLKQALAVFKEIRSPSAEQVRRLLAQLQSGGAPSSGPSPEQILQQFERVIEAVVAAAHGHPQARAAVETAFEQLEQGDWRIVAPIQRIWDGERDAETLTAGLDESDTFIVREILKRL
jgi:tetratricopeptide (TPR) repeat protein/tRNA A-37 threonylcarbamoyl transferase component Bud32